MHTLVLESTHRFVLTAWGEPRSFRLELWRARVPVGSERFVAALAEHRFVRFVAGGQFDGAVHDSSCWVDAAELLPAALTEQPFAAADTDDARRQVEAAIIEVVERQTGVVVRFE